MPQRLTLDATLIQVRHRRAQKLDAAPHAQRQVNARRRRLLRHYRQQLYQQRQRPRQQLYQQRQRPRQQQRQRVCRRVPAKLERVLAISISHTPRHLASSALRGGRYRLDLRDRNDEASGDCRIRCGVGAGAIATTPVAHADWCTDHGMTGIALTTCEKGRALVGTPCEGNVDNPPGDPNGLSHPRPDGCDPNLPWKESTGQ